MTGFRFSVPQAFCLTLILLVMSLSASAQTYTDLHDFSPVGGDPSYFNVAGWIPQGRDGNLYGVSHFGGTSDIGTVFSMTPTGTPTILASFIGSNGSYPFSGLTLGTDGNFYGVGSLGGTSNAGTIVKVTPTGTLTVLYNFTGVGDGGYPTFPPVQAADGNFYGVASGNDSGNQLTSAFYKITPTGTFTVLHVFTTAEGNQCSGVILGSDGNFYGACNFGGANSDGTLYKVSTAGKVTVLHNLNGIDGQYPGALVPVEGKDGNYYGVTYLGGSANSGVVYQLKPSGAYTVLHNFTGGSDGGFPLAPLTLATDGKLYGTTSNGGNVIACPSGTIGCGVIFKITTTGAFTVLHTFGFTEGAYPQSNLTLRTDGLFYGDTFSGGAMGQGVFYSLSTGIQPFVSLVTTSGKEGAKIGILGQGFSRSSVVKFGGIAATSIALTGTTFINATVPTGALTGAVTVTTGSSTLTSAQTFKVKPTLLSFSPGSGSVGTSVMITGTGLTQASKVTFNGTSATFTVNSDALVTATVPTGATTGKISVITSGGSATSGTNFTVN